MKQTKSYGIAGEQFVAAQLEKKGYTICAQNYTKPYGEIDIIAQKGGTILFVEVKARKNPLFDMAALVTPSKQRKIIMVAQQYLLSHRYPYTECRFDVALVTKAQEEYTLSYIPNAFSGD